MEDKYIKEAIAKAKALLSDLSEPEKAMSFPVVLAHILSQGRTVMPTRTTNSSDAPTAKVDDGENFTGLSGGMRLLLSEGFFKEGRSQGDISAELTRQGYHYPKSSLPAVLLGLIQKRAITRIKGSDGNWRYIERK